MFKSRTIGQLSFFPDLFQSSSFPSITTLPQFDRALDNLIKMSDLGAFISITVHGVEKSYSVHPRELEIPDDFILEEAIDSSSDTFHLFPHEIRHHLRNRAYDAKSFFNTRNSFKTPFGFFLYRPYFRIWHRFVEERKQEVDSFLSRNLKGRVYGQLFLTAFKKGYGFLESIRDETAPWEFLSPVRLSRIRQVRKEIRENNLTLHSLDKTIPEFPLKAIVLKTMHFPETLKDYLNQLHLQYTFRSVHLDYLKDLDIQTIEDVKKFSQGLVDQV
ncbi:MAG: hypothetical protein ACE5HZ_03605 [Fidelibacterota bacterium]